MGNSVDTRTVEPKSHGRNSDIVLDRITPVAVDDQPAISAYLDDTSRLYHLYSHCRDVCVDPSGIRIVAASALIIGFLLVTAPAALAPVGLLLSTAPAALTRDTSNPDEPAPRESARDEPTREEPSTGTDDVKGISDAQRPSDVRSATALITWDGTSQALKCTYGLLFEGNTRGCH